MATFSATPSSMTSEEEAILLAEFSTDGTWATLDEAAILNVIATNDTSRLTSLGVGMGDVVLMHTMLTGSLTSAWEPELVDPNFVDELEEWADLAVSEDLAQDIRDFIALVLPSDGLATALTGHSSSLLATDLDAGERALSATEVGDMVNRINEYWTAKPASENTEMDAEALINIAFEAGAYGAAVIFLLMGTLNPETGEMEDGYLDSVSEGQQNLASQIVDATEEVDALAEEMDGMEDSGELTSARSEADQLSAKISTMGQIMTTMQTMITSMIDLGSKSIDIQSQTSNQI